MFSEKSILIIEDNCYQALDLSLAIESMDGRVVGPVCRVADALEILDQGIVSGAILDCELEDRDSRPVAEMLIKRQLPFVIHTANALPSVIDVLHPDIPVMIKPQQPEAVLRRLLDEIRRTLRSESLTAGRSS